MMLESPHEPLLAKLRARSFRPGHPALRRQEALVSHASSTHPGPVNQKRGPDEPRIYEMLMRLRSGGTITVSAYCTNAEVAEAKAQRRYYEDKDGVGYVYKNA